MAGIDKIYGTHAEYETFKKWCEENNPSLLGRLYHYDTSDEPEKVRPISNFTTEQDIWLYANCSLDFIVDRIKGQYNGEPH